MYAPTRSERARETKRERERERERERKRGEREREREEGEKGRRRTSREEWRRSRFYYGHFFASRARYQYYHNFTFVIGWHRASVSHVSRLFLPLLSARPPFNLSSDFIFPTGFPQLSIFSLSACTFIALSSSFLSLSLSLSLFLSLFSLCVSLPFSFFLYVLSHRSLSRHSFFPILQLPLRSSAYCALVFGLCS